MKRPLDSTEMISFISSGSLPLPPCKAQRRKGRREKEGEEEKREVSIAVSSS